MKIDPGSRAAAPVARTEKPATAPAPVATPGWQASTVARPKPATAAPVSDDVARAALTAHATAAVSRALTEPRAPHGLVEQFGQALGLGLGVVVTEALAAVPDWNTPVVDATGQQVSAVPGAERQGDHPLLKRHQEVVGPQIAALVAKLPPGMVHDLLDGLARGATAAPGTSYRLEAAAADLFE